MTKRFSAGIAGRDEVHDSLLCLVGVLGVFGFSACSVGMGEIDPAANQPRDQNSPAERTSFSTRMRIIMNGTMEPRLLAASCPNPLRSWSDEKLLLSYRAERDGGVFEELVHRYEKELFGYLRHYLGNAEMADDVFQQTFLQVHLKCDQFEPGRKVRPWLYTIATHQAIDYRRRNRRHRMSSLSPAAYPNVMEEAHALAELLGGPATGPADKAESAEQYRTSPGS